MPKGWVTRWGERLGKEGGEGTCYQPMEGGKQTNDSINIISRDVQKILYYVHANIHYFEAQPCKQTLADKLQGKPLRISH